MISKYDIIRAVEAEFNRIDTPDKKFHLDHEAWAVLLEEIEEMFPELNYLQEKKLQAGIAGEMSYDKKV